MYTFKLYNTMLDTHIHSEMDIAVKLINISVSSHNYLVLGGGESSGNLLSQQIARIWYSINCRHHAAHQLSRLIHPQLYPLTNISFFWCFKSIECASQPAQGLPFLPTWPAPISSWRQCRPQGTTWASST